MYKKIVFALICYPLLTHAQFDMTMDRVSTTDIPTEFTQIYYKPRNPTRATENVPARRNRWARCNKKNLDIKEYCQDEDIV